MMVNWIVAKVVLTVEAQSRHSRQRGRCQGRYQCKLPRATLAAWGPTTTRPELATSRLAKAKPWPWQAPKPLRLG